MQNESVSLSALQPRDGPADLLKALGCICVIIIHTASQSMSGLRIPSFNWVSAVFWGSLCRAAVPVFLMVTGALLLDPGRRMDTRHIYSRYFLRTLICLLFWALMYQLYFVAGYWILYRQFDPAWLLDAVKSTLLFDHHFHLYYLQLLLILYILLPVLRVLTAHAERETLRYALIVWAALGILLPMLCKYQPLSDLTGIPAQYPLTMTWAAPGYALLGWYIKSAEPQRRDARIYAVIFAAGFALVFGGTVIASLVEGGLNQDFIDCFTPGPALMALGAFGLAYSLWTPGESEAHAKAAGRIRALSRASFCVYLVHHFFVMLLRTYLYTAYQYACLILIPVQAAAVLACSLAVYAVLGRIPWVRDHLI